MKKCKLCGKLVDEDAWDNDDGLCSDCWSDTDGNYTEGGHDIDDADYNTGN